MKRKVYRRRIKIAVAKKAPMHDGVLVAEIQESTPLTTANFKAWAESHNNAMSDFLAKARAWAGAVLRAAGLPDDMRDVLVQPDGTWQELPPGWNDWPLERQLEQYPKGFSVCQVDTLAKDRMLESGELTMADHAAAVVRYADEMERAIRDGAAAQAAACGVRLGEAWQRAMFAEHLEKATVHGAKDLADRSSAHKYWTPKTWWPDLAAALAHKSNADAWLAICESPEFVRQGKFAFCRDKDGENDVLRVGRLDADNDIAYFGFISKRQFFDEYLASARKPLKAKRKK